MPNIWTQVPNIWVQVPNIGQNVNLAPRIPNSCSSPRPKKSGWQYLRNEKRYQRSVGIKTPEFSGAFQMRIFWFLDFCIFLDFWLYLGNEKSYQRSVGIQMTEFSRAFQIFKKIEFLDFWNSGFPDFWIRFGFLAIYFGNKKSYQRSVGIQGTKFSRAFQMFKQIEFLDFWVPGFPDFWIYGFLYFFWISCYISGTKRATRDPLVSKQQDFQGLFRLSKKLNFRISGFLYFWGDFLLYLGNEKSYQRSVSPKNSVFLDFWLYR